MADSTDLLVSTYPDTNYSVMFAYSPFLCWSRLRLWHRDCSDGTSVIDEPISCRTCIAPPRRCLGGVIAPGRSLHDLAVRRHIHCRHPHQQEHRIRVERF